MDNYQGDLTDILRASCTTGSGGGALGQSADGPGTASAISNWEFSSDPVLNNLASSTSALEDDINNNRDNNNHVFGDPFVNIRDPLLHEFDVVASGCSAYFSSPNSTDHILSSVDDPHSLSGASSTSNLLGRQHHDHKAFEEDQMNNNNYDHSPCGIFSRIQISQSNSANLPVSPCDSSVITDASPRGFKASPMVSIDMISANSPKNCLIDSSGAVQISSPRNMGIKRRKSQAKKVLCVPAPAAANSRASGEVVPSDLWAWRKYGQKPIKGSPYPRGYYRCSSSKGCSARKQVERSRTDPNMLVITYTSEHNHPWPTQRNALAGSTRSQPPKISAAGSKSSPSSHHQKAALSSKDEQKESSNDTLSPSNKVAAESAPVKEEIEDVSGKHVVEMNDSDLFGSEVFPSYRPIMPDPNQSEDFFSELGEIEADTLRVLLSQDGFSGDREQKDSKGLNSYGIFDWPTDENNNNNKDISFEEAKRGL